MNNNRNSFSIKQWDEIDRPRERMLLHGRSDLSDSELLAIILGSGSRYESAVSLSKRILFRVDHDLIELGKLSINDLMQFKGVGKAKAISIAAALELGKRRKENSKVNRKKINSSQSLFELMQPRIGDLPHEEFWVIYVNNSNKVLQSKQISKGGITGTLVDVRLVLKTALEIGAVAILMVHNHPSGSLKPSELDKKLTKKIKQAGESMDIRVLDHIIITEKTYFSFADEQLL